MAFAAVAALVTAVFALLSYERISTDVVREREDVALRQSYANARIARARLRGEAPDPGGVLASLESGQGTPVLFFGGEWFASSVGAGRPDIPDSLLQLVADGRSGHQRVRLGGELRVVVGVSVPAVGADYYEFVALGDVEATLRAVRASLSLGALIATVLGGALGAVVSGTLLRPIRTMTGAARAVGGGNLTTYVDATGIPDLDPLIDAFNGMVDELRARIDRDARFAGDVTHELRGPLAALAAASSRARRHADNPVELQRSLEVLDENVERFNALVVDLLEMSRLEAGVAELNRETIDVHEFLRAVLATTHSSAELTIGSRVPASIAADKRRLGQCLINLIQNAERYGGGATRVTAMADAGELRFVVDDDGPGVPEHERTYIFGRFARGAAANEVSGGTGLGLALVAEHMRLHDGRVQVTSSPTGGARFTLHLPLGDAP